MGNCFDNKKVQPGFDNIQHIESISNLNNLKIDFIENHPKKYIVKIVKIYHSGMVV
jgi:hypothetical protein